MKLNQRLSRCKNPETLLNSYKRLIYLKGQISVVINSNMIDDAAKWDGLYGVILICRENTKLPRCYLTITVFGRSNSFVP